MRRSPIGAIQRVEDRAGGYLVGSALGGKVRQDAIKPSQIPHPLADCCDVVLSERSDLAAGQVMAAAKTEQGADLFQ